MSFFASYLRGKIEDRMEDPEVREKNWEARLRSVESDAKAVKKHMEYPTKNWGFWRSEKFSAQYELNSTPIIQHMPGRGRPQY